jgi:hypothetical protein
MLVRSQTPHVTRLSIASAVAPSAAFLDRLALSDASNSHFTIWL